MADPTAPTIALAATGITVFGVATGLPPDLILPSFCGALWALRSCGQASMLTRISQVFAGTMFATWMTPVAALLVGKFLPEAAGVSPAALRFPVAVLLGWGGLSLVLPLIEKRFGGQQQ